MSGTHPWGVEISYSHLRAYLECPWQYKLKYLDFKRPPLTPASSLGISIHGALEMFHARGGGDFESLLDAYDSRWLHTGFSSPQEQMEWYRRGEDILRRYLECESSQASRIIAVEREFVFSLGNHSVRGKIDRIDQRADGSYEVVDYKTHLEIVNPAAAAADLQLRIYALALREGLELEPGWVTFYYVAAGQRVSAAYDPAGEEALRALLVKVCDKMAAEGELQPDTSFCPQCGFRDSCARAPRG